jgi:hypothetical protein
MSEDEAIARVWDAAHEPEPDTEQAPECECGEELLTRMERRHGVCGFCADDRAAYARDEREIVDVEGEAA